MSGLFLGGPVYGLWVPVLEVGGVEQVQKVCRRPSLRTRGGRQPGPAPAVSSGFREACCGRHWLSTEVSGLRSFERPVLHAVRWAETATKAGDVAGRAERGWPLPCSVATRKQLCVENLLCSWALQAKAWLSVCQ